VVLSPAEPSPATQTRQELRLVLEKIVSKIGERDGLNGKARAPGAINNNDQASNAASQAVPACPS
jgi:hypothetical protein